MKKIINMLLAAQLFLCACWNVSAQDFKEHISKQFNVGTKDPVLAIYNVFGNIKVEGYEGDKVLLEIDKTISSRYAEEVENGKKEFKLEMEQVGDSIVVYIVAPYDSRPNTWQNDRRNIRYKYQLDFTVKVPRSMKLRVSTVNNGEIDVKHVLGDLVVHNVNGGITIDKAKGVTRAVTVNGPIRINYLSNPTAASEYKTINGDIEVYYKGDLSADLYFKSMNGKYYTDFENAENLSNTISRNTETKNNATIYKINKDAGVRIGNGGRKFNFETLNGNIYIKKS